MPYIDNKARLKIEYKGENINYISELSSVIENEGELNYVITRLCSNFLKQKGEKYSVYNTLIGVLDCVKLEFYRRKVSTYEDTKIKINGDVYE